MIYLKEGAEIYAKIYYDDDLMMMEELQTIQIFNSGRIGKINLILVI